MCAKLGGPNLLTVLVGSLGCSSSTFYAALSAVGFAYSLQIFFPAMPIVPTAIGIILVFVVLNILGVGNIGNSQILLGGTLLFVLLAYIILGLSLPGGFRWSTFLSGGRFFIHDGGWGNSYRLLSTLHIYSKTTEPDDIEDELNFPREIVVDELGLIPACLIPRISRV